MRNILLVVLLLCSIVESEAQSFTSLPGGMDMKLYKARVKLVDEFIDRFNGEEGRPDIKTADSLYREKNLLLLFDGALFKADKEKFFRESKEMIDSIISHNTRIAFSDSLWFATVTCHGRFKGKEAEFKLFLSVEKRKEDMFKWVITKASGNIFRLIPSKKADNIILMPDDHETNFMSLHRITTEKDDYITNYSAKEFTVDETSVFFSYVYSGLLDIENVDELEFTFLQVPGYVFSIKDVFRETLNSGWLIHSFKKTSNEEKKSILNNLHK